MGPCLQRMAIANVAQQAIGPDERARVEDDSQAHAGQDTAVHFRSGYRLPLERRLDGDCGQSQLSVVSLPAITDTASGTTQAASAVDQVRSQSKSRHHNLEAFSPVLTLSRR